MKVKAIGLWLACCILLAAPLAPAFAQAGSAARPSTGGDERPYDAQLQRLAEILGALHYLRELCGAGEGQVWRNQMRELLAAEGTTALRRARLSENFNRGYRSYSRTYRSCTPPARSAISRFMEQGAALTDKLAQESR